MPNDTTKILRQDNWQIPDKYKDRIIEAPQPVVEDALSIVPEGREQAVPIVVSLDAQEIGRLYAYSPSPYHFMQELLRKFKAAGAPVEGVLKLRLAHGAVVKVKQQPGQMKMSFDYMWLPAQHVEAIVFTGKVN